MEVSVSSLSQTPPCAGRNTSYSTNLHGTDKAVTTTFKARATWGTHRHSGHMEWGVRTQWWGYRIVLSRCRGPLRCGTSFQIALVMGTLGKVPTSQLQDSLSRKCQFHGHSARAPRVQAPPPRDAWETEGQFCDTELTKSADVLCTDCFTSSRRHKWTELGQQGTSFFKGWPEGIPSDLPPACKVLMEGTPIVSQPLPMTSTACGSQAEMDPRSH